MRWPFSVRGADRQVKAPEPSRLEVSADFFPGMGVSVLDNIVKDRGIAAYREMSRDAEVSADTDLRLAGMMPGLQITPADESEEAARAALLCDSICSTMRGALLNTLRDQMLREAVVTGFMVAEPIQTVINLPEFGGAVLGLSDIRVRPSEGFSGRIKINSGGDILSFNQYTMSGIKTATPDQVLYYAFSGTPWNPEGRSLYHAAYDYWRLKVALHKLFGIHMTVNASGIRELEIPADFFERDKVAAKTMLDKLGETASIVRKDNQRLTLHIPQGTAGYHFIRGIRELCNAEIRKAILYDEAVNAEGQKTGSYASRKVSQSNVYNAMAAQGYAYCESIAEQLFRRLLDWNGFDTWPTPLLIPEPVANEQGNAAEILSALGSLYQSGTLTTPLTDDVQAQILRQTLRPLGIETGVKAPVEDTTPATASEHVHQRVIAKAPPGRTRADVLRLKRRAVESENEAVGVAVESWDAATPGIVKALSSALFNSDGTWKSRDYGVLREAADKAVTGGGTDLRKNLTETLANRWAEGEADAAKMVKVSAAVNVTPVRVSPAQARSMLRQRVYLMLRDQYGSVSDALYFQIENAVNGNLSAQQVIPQIRQTLTEAGITPGRARTILNTAMSTAYNQGRMSLFASLSDPDGTTPGGIIGYELSAVMDDETTPICSELNDRFFKVDDPNLPQPPLHYNCRSVLIPVFSGETPWNADGSWVSLEDSKGMSAGIAPGFGGT